MAEAKPIAVVVDNDVGPNSFGPMPTIGTMVEKYIALRDKVHDIKETHKKQLEPYTDMIASLESLILAELERSGAKAMRCAAGTVYESVQTSVTVKDWGQALGFIQQNELWDLLEARVNKTAAMTVIEERAEPIPGVHVSQAAVLRVRRT